MKYGISGLATAFLVATVGTASANVTMVNCPGYILSIADDVVITGQQRMGSAAAFDARACSLADQLGLDAADSPYRARVFIEGLGQETVVVVIPTSDDE